MVSFNKIRLEKNGSFPKAYECEDFYVFNLTTNRFHFKERGDQRWRRMDSLGPAIAAPKTVEGECYAGEKLVYICTAKGVVQTFYKEDWVSNGIPLPEAVSRTSNRTSPTPLEALMVVNDDWSPSSFSAGKVDRISFNGNTGVLSYQPWCQTNWVHLTCSPTIEIADLSLKTGDYKVMNGLVYIRGFSKLFYLEESEFREMLALRNDEFFIPTDKVVTGWTGWPGELTRNTVTLKPSTVHVYNSETGMSHTVNDVIFIVRPPYFDNELLITPQGIIAIPEGFRLDKTFENSQTERLLKGIPGAYKASADREVTKVESILSDDFMRPVPIIVKSEDKNGGEVPENVLARIETLEKHVEKILTHIKGVM